MSSLSQLLLHLQGWLIAACSSSVAVYQGFSFPSSEYPVSFGDFLLNDCDSCYLFGFVLLSYIFTLISNIFASFVMKVNSVSLFQLPKHQPIKSCEIDEFQHHLTSLKLLPHLSSTIFFPSQSIFFLKPHSGPLTSLGSRASAPVSLCIKMVMLLCL